MVISVYRSSSSTANEDEALLPTLCTAARHNGKLLILEDFNTPEINWGGESVPSGSFGHALLNLLHDEALMQHVREDTRWQDGSKPTRLDLVITKEANDIESIQVMAPLGKSDHALLHLTMSIRESTAPDKRGRNYEGMNIAQLLRDANTMSWELDPRAVRDEQNEDGVNAESNAEKADIFRRYFERVHQPDRGGNPPPPVEREILAMAEVIIIGGEVKAQLQALKSTKAAGPDDIHTAILKPLAEVLAAPLAKLFNRSLQEGRLPGDWKVANVVPIHKGGNRNQAANYRPVSLTSVPLKVMESLQRDNTGL
ncbi:unnamed protein product [Echinostoma caproni]|uniref:Endo/exonuclease/phosphatase domain-containing protein n=1 Tax=Echinostoma caproni TaxID=27848 RepID=A0A183B9S4_9TREM|nr:unnamed protein product [Echinostoma caproni]